MFKYKNFKIFKTLNNILMIRKTYIIVKDFLLVLAFSIKFSQQGINMVDVMNEIYDSDSQDLFKIVSENTTDLIALLNEESKFEYVNAKAHKKLTGYTEEDLIGKIATDLIHPKDQKKTLRNLKSVFKKGEIEGETRLKCKDGGYIWVTMKAVRFFDSDGKVKVLLIAKEIFYSDF